MEYNVKMLSQGNKRSGRNRSRGRARGVILPSTNDAARRRSSTAWETGQYRLNKDSREEEGKRLDVKLRKTSFNARRLCCRV